MVVSSEVQAKVPLHRTQEIDVGLAAEDLLDELEVGQVVLDQKQGRRPELHRLGRRRKGGGVDFRTGR